MRKKAREGIEPPFDRSAGDCLTAWLSGHKQVTSNVVFKRFFPYKNNRSYFLTLLPKISSDS